MKGVVLTLCYIVIAACFFVLKTPLTGKYTYIYIYVMNIEEFEMKLILELTWFE